MICNIVIWLVLYSVVGWIYETSICSFDQRKYVRRGFLYGPYCPIYGFGAVLDIMILGKLENPIQLFFGGAVLACLLEYFTAWLLESLFHSKWWDYSKWKFNIKGRVCVIGAVVFGMFSVALIKVIHPIMSMEIDRVSDTMLLCLALFGLLTLTIDTIYTTNQIKGFRDKKVSFNNI